MILDSRQNFRKNLRKLYDLIVDKKTQIVLTTATLPPKFEKSIFNTLFLSHQKALIFRLSSDRSNIRYIVRQNQTDSDILDEIRKKDE